MEIDRSPCQWTDLMCNGPHCPTTPAESLIDRSAVQGRTLPPLQRPAAKLHRATYTVLWHDPFQTVLFKSPLGPLTLTSKDASSCQLSPRPHTTPKATTTDALLFYPFPSHTPTHPQRSIHRHKQCFLQPKRGQQMVAHRKAHSGMCVRPPVSLGL
jgi:hypothetical protein